MSTPRIKVRHSVWHSRRYPRWVWTCIWTCTSGEPSRGAVRHYAPGAYKTPGEAADAGRRHLREKHGVRP